MRPPLSYGPAAPASMASTRAWASSRMAPTGRSVSMVSMTSWSMTALMGCQAAVRGSVLA